ncbi:MAG: citryl-CoA lyase [Anaerolineae bacterium]
MDAWRSAITDTGDGVIRIRGYEISELLHRADFTEVIFLLHQARLPTETEKRLLNAILVASSDHGPISPSTAAARIVASGNRQSFEAAVGAGILAIGDAHGGAGQACMEMIDAGLRLAEEESLSFEEAANRVVARATAEGRRIPGLGHRFHKIDPRVDTIFDIARSNGLAGDGINFFLALQHAASEQIRDLPINVDGALAAALYDMGFSPALGKALFILGRVAGLTAHVHEELVREKPMRFRPPVVYDGPPVRRVE